MNLQYYFACPSYMRKGDNVKIYMQMMDLEYSKKFFFSKKLEFSLLQVLMELYLASIVRNHL